MKLKQIPQDFIVKEVYELNRILGHDPNSSNEYKYLTLTKTDYSQQRAIDKIVRIFNLSRKDVHFAGTKDKVGVTTQTISLKGISKDRIDKHLQYFNEKIEDIQLEYIGSGSKRINLGDNLGNDFEITLRDLDENDISLIEKNITKIKQKGVLNYYDSQRFGYANNSHIVGKYVLQNELTKAVYEILTSKPKDPNTKIEEFVNLVESNWEKIIESDTETIKEIISKAPKFMYLEKDILAHLRQYKNDFPGAFRTINKKMRTMYLSAYQSYIFNTLLDKFGDKYQFLPLVNSATQFENDEIKNQIEEILKEDNLSLDNFNLSSMPELKVEIEADRKTVIFAEGIDIIDREEDELNEGKLKLRIKFFLEKGAYATNVIKNLV